MWVVIMEMIYQWTSREDMWKKQGNMVNVYHKRDSFGHCAN